LPNIKFCFAVNWRLTPFFIAGSGKSHVSQYFGYGDPFVSNGDFEGLILVGRLCGFLQLAAIVVGVARRPES
jgi:hypothetical protein